ncbi:sigma 54-interacting transcriptional regulator [Sedimentibacter sp.]|uniref:sigma 54-interacting transcriptional regulator n=1 Tax=Sedimentibacter sp. TaxID=1960295 RepID=UPI0028A8C523|nr:sigma 54-interacting transcriptional regulator [Sedimentibacter sp.]
MISFVIQKHDHVLNGWERCQYLKTNRRSGLCDNDISESDLNNLLAKHKDLIKTAHPFMEQMERLLNNYLLIALVNKDGYIIDEIQPHLKKRLDNAYFCLGGRFSEEYNGNTSISTSIIENKPICLIGDDHYCDCYHDLASMSAPIYYNNEIIGTVSVIAFKGRDNNDSLSIIESIAKIIGLGYESNNNNKELNLRYKLQSAIINSFTDGLLIIDKNGYLEYINQVGAEILNIEREKSIGRHVAELVDFKPVILDVLKTGQGYVDEEIIVSDRTGVKTHFIKTAVPIKDDDGNIVNVVDTFRKIKRVQKLINEMTGAYSNFRFDDIIGNSTNLKKCIKIAKIAANSTSNVLITGESGTGKELIAHSIHSYSDRRDQPFVTINCGAIPRELLESELFGYEAGSFTGASTKGRTGKFELAEGGTIFLDEIGEMPLDMQVKLLRVLQDKKVTRVGGYNVFNVDVKIIAATNKDLIKLCDQGLFRRDLYYRINVLNVKIPSMRERKSDIPILVEYFINKYSYRLDKTILGISPDALDLLINYDWLGNVRELENVLERAVNICEGNMITEKEINSDLFYQDNDINQHSNMNSANENDIVPLEVLEERAIKQALTASNGNITTAANMLKVTRNTIYNKVKKYNLGNYQI